MKNSNARGICGENTAALYMEKSGFVILERNYRRTACEVDIIAMEGDVLVFTEVKARSSARYGYGREAVDRRKQQRIIRGALNYISENRMEDKCGRFDVAEVDLNTGTVNYIRSAFEM